MKNARRSSAGLALNPYLIRKNRMRKIAQSHLGIHPSGLPLFAWASQRCTTLKPKLVSWRVNRWLGVDRVEVR